MPAPALLPAACASLLTTSNSCPHTHHPPPTTHHPPPLQVLTRPNSSRISRPSILDGPAPLLQLDQPYNYSSVLTDLAYTGDAASGGPTGLRDALYATAPGPEAVPRSVVGMVHTRLRPPEVAMRFRVRGPANAAACWQGARRGDGGSRSCGEGSGRSQGGELFGLRA